MVKLKENMFEEGIRAPQKSRESNIAKTLKLQDNEFDGDGNEEPEVVSANREDMLKLRELHEQMMLPASKRTKKRKTRPLLQIANIKKGTADNEELDDSVLTGLGSVNVKEANKHEISLRKDEAKETSRMMTPESRNNGIDSYPTKSRKM